jgi:hypothetical protein
MKRYGNRSGDSGVIAYDEGKDWVKAQFSNRKTYRYSYKSAGMHAVEQLRELARKGKGLSTFISQNNPPYDNLSE